MEERAIQPIINSDIFDRESTQLTAQLGRLIFEDLCHTSLDKIHNRE